MLTSKAFSDIVTFSRSSNATRIGPTGRVEYAPHNLLVRSQEFDNASWTKDGTTVTSNSIAAPDGSITADKLVEDSSTGNHWAYASISNTNTTISVYAKAAERNFVALACAGEGLCYFNLSTGAVVSTAANCSTSITSVGNGWYRCVVSATGTGSFGILGVSANGTTVSYAGTTGSGVYIWGAQLSVGPYPLDYTPTTSAAVYGPRFDYNPSTLAARGLLIEEQRTNNLSYSEQFDNAAWTKARSSITANAATSPGGTVTADQSTIDNTNGFHDACYQTFSATSGTSYTFSIFVKKNVGIEAVYFYTDATSPGAIAKFNLTTGAYIGNAPGNGYSAFTSYSSTALSNGWYRIVATVTAASTNPSTFFTIGMSTNTNDTVAQFTGNGTDNFYLWGAQLEAGSFATSYIPTVASSVTRSADVASVNTLSPWFNATEGTIYAQWNRIYTGNFPSYSRVFEIGASNNWISANGNLGTDSFYLEIVSGGSGQLTYTPFSAGNSVQKTAIAYKQNDTQFSNNNVVYAVDTACLMPVGVTTLGLGQTYNGSGQINGHLRQISYYPRRLSSAELAALTA